MYIHRKLTHRNVSKSKEKRMKDAMQWLLIDWHQVIPKAKIYLEWKQEEKRCDSRNERFARFIHFFHHWFIHVLRVSLFSIFFSRTVWSFSYCCSLLSQHTLTCIYYTLHCMCCIVFCYTYNGKHDNTTLPNYITALSDLFPLTKHINLIFIWFCSIRRTIRVENRRIYRAQGAHTFRLVRCSQSVHYEYPTICCLAITLPKIMSLQIAPRQLPSPRLSPLPQPAT